MTAVLSPEGVRVDRRVSPVLVGCAFLVALSANLNKSQKQIEG